MRLAMASLLVLALPACGGTDPAATRDGGPSVVEETGSDTGASDTLVDKTDSAKTDTSVTEVGPACTPKPGADAVKAYCDLFELAYFTKDGGAPRVELHGRVSPTLPDTACAIVDTVEVQTGGKTIATLAAAGNFTSGDERALLATGAGFDALKTRCDGDANRFGEFGFVLTGRMDGGTFTAKCAEAEGGGRWPPAVRVTCHHNVDAIPLAGSASVMSSSSFSSSSLHVSVPHGPGGALKTTDGKIHVIPGFSSFGSTPGSLAPFDSAGWEGTLSEATSPRVMTSLYLSNTKSALPSELCPAPSTGTPPPGSSPPPVFLARITGSGEHGAYSTEAYVNYCTRTSM